MREFRPRSGGRAGRAAAPGDDGQPGYLLVAYGARLAVAGLAVRPKKVSQVPATAQTR